MVFDLLPPRDYFRLCVSTGRQHWRQFVFPILAVLILQIFFRIDINGVTHSLPGHVFVTVKAWRTVGPGDYVTFEWQGGGPYVKGTNFIKIVKGVAGDEIRVTSDGEFLLYPSRAGTVVNQLGGESLGRAKPVSSKGVPLERGPTGIIPDGHFYVYAPHPDSLDSRYALTGWIRKDQIVGRAFVIF